ncbi:MAG: hypothetical protein ACRDD8_16150 [Bacteroidales bacterium]
MKHNDSCCSVYEIIFLLKGLNIKFVEFLPSHMKQTCFAVLVNDLKSFGIEPVMITNKQSDFLKAKQKGIKYISSKSKEETHGYSLWLSSAIKFSKYNKDIDYKSRALWWKTDKGIVAKFTNKTGERILLGVIDGIAERIKGVYE